MEKNKCEPLENEQRDRALFGFNYCMNRNGRETWTSYTYATSCELFYKRPKCLVYNKKAYSFTRYSTSLLPDYDLPPCFSETENWVVEAVCNSRKIQNYTCKNNKWVGADGTKVSSCISNDTLERIRIDNKNEDETVVEEMTSEENRNKRQEDSVNKETVKLRETQNPWKEFMIYYDLSNSEEIKMVKGVMFGKWENNKCRYLRNSETDLRAEVCLNSCVRRLFHKVRYGVLRITNYGVYSPNTMCLLSDETPDCFIYNREGLSFTSFSVSDVNDHVLPPCIEASKQWTIEAICDRRPLQSYTCDGVKWVGVRHGEISGCKQISYKEQPVFTTMKSHAEKLEKSVDYINESEDSENNEVMQDPDENEDNA